MSKHRCLYFGCWNGPGHFLFAPGGRDVGSDAARLVYYGDHVHLDGTLAPRRMKRSGHLCWQGQGKTRDDRWAILDESEEYPQGQFLRQFLRHELDTWFTVIQWWDRTQGDSRGACNSTILLEGRHTSDEMLAALKEHFPHVLENLTKAGVTLVEVRQDE
jgi:hypothetical protein